MDTLGSVCALRLGIRCVFVCLKLYHWVAKSGWSVLSLAKNPEREENNPGLIDVRRRRSLLLGDPKFDLFPNLWQWVSLCRLVIIHYLLTHYFPFRKMICPQFQNIISDYQLLYTFSSSFPLHAFCFSSICPQIYLALYKLLLASHLVKCPLEPATHTQLLHNWKCLQN